MRKAPLMEPDKCRSVAKNPDWDRRVNKPRLTKRIKKPARTATMMEQRMLGITAVLRKMKESELTLRNIEEVFGRLMYFNTLPPAAREVRAWPLMRKLARLNKVEDWTK